MDLIPAPSDSRLIFTPHPILLDGQKNVTWHAMAGESLYVILQRNVPHLDGNRFDVTIGGRKVERHLWHSVKPKQGQVIEVRGGVGKAALMVVAMVALTYFTMGAGAGWIAGTFGVASGGIAAATIGAGLFLSGSMIINKVLGPKPPKASNQQQDSVYSISGARNQLRPYDPIPLLFGRVRITPDLLSKPYSWYQGNDQYLGLLLSSGINVGRIEPLYNGDTLLSSFEGVTVQHAGYTEMAEESIPLYSNADTIDGAELPKDRSWVTRTSSADTVRLQINLEYILGGTGTSGKSYFVNETIESQYRKVGDTTWMPLVTRTFRNEKFDVMRASLTRDVERGQYEVRVRSLGIGNYTGKNTHKNDFQWTTLTSIQVDEADYTGIARTAVTIKATGQLNGSPDELRGVAYASPIPVWNGTEWVTKETSNPGAQGLAYIRGIYKDGRFLAGMGLSDDEIDIESWKAFSLFCEAHGYEYNFYIKDARSHDQALAAITLAGFGEITRATGKLGVAWVGQEQPITGVANMATMKKGSFQVDYTLVNAADGIEYTYIDSSDWQAKTIRVPAPGVTTMLNPAQVSGEGVSTEAHAAIMARWHLAQSLYQYKEISFSTDIEVLSFRRLSLLSVSHDMTQWGYSGRVQGASVQNGVVTLTLDDKVPPPPPGGAYIGVRIPGERVYRVMRVASFNSDSFTVSLADPWPAGVPLPGNTASNPAHDTIWVYDFKATPGLKVRVTSIEPEDDLKGASVRVVPESAEFWNYVHTGEYIPAPNESLLQTRPVISNVAITEAEIVQGDTTFTELTATFDVSGPVGTTVVRSAPVGMDLQEVAQTSTRIATWRIGGPGTYNISLRAFSPSGDAGPAVSLTYVTIGAGSPPVLVDLFDVQERSGGVRLYTWGWLGDTIRSPDFAGVEIRYTAGNVTSPDWETMTPLGESGYYTAPFESVLPPAGDWTIACRSRNTAGLLSVEMRTVSHTFGPNLGELIDGIDGTIGQTLDELIALQQAIDQETYDRIAGDLATASAAGADATAKANAARNDALAAVAQVNDQVIQLTSQVDVISGQIGDITDADLWSVDESYPAGDHVKYDGKLYRALQPSVGMQPNTNPTYWQWVGDYSSVGEAVAASLSMSRTNASDIDVQTSRVDGIVVRMPTGTDKLANEARVVAAETAAVNANSATANRVGAVEVRMPAGNGMLGTAADVAAAASAAQAASDKAGGKGEVIYGSSEPATDKRLPQNLWIDTTGNANTPKRWNGTAWVVVTDKVATDAAAAAAAALAHSQTVDARVTNVESASVSRDNALGSRLGVVEVRMPTGTDKLANEARVVTAENAAANATSAVATQVTNLSAKVASIGRAGDNAIYDGDFEMYDDGQVLVNQGSTIGTAVVTTAAAYSGTKSVVLTRGSSQTGNLDLSLPRDGSVIACNGARTWYAEAMVRRAPSSAVSTGNTRLNLYARVTKTDGNFEWPLFASITIGEVGTNWTKISGRATTSSNAVGIIGLVTLVAANSQNGAAFMVDSFVMRDVTEAQAVAADLTVVNQARIDGDNALAGQIVTAQSTANNAQSTATTALSTANNAASVASSAQTAAGNAQSTATTALNTANNAASSVATVASRVGGSANLVANSDLSMELAGWNIGWNPGNWGGPMIGLAGPDWSPSNVKTLGVYKNGTVSSGSYMVVYSDKIPVEAAKWYILSARTANHRCRVRLAMRFSNPTNGNVGEPGTDWIASSYLGGRNLESWASPYLRVQAPAGATDVEIGFWADGIGEADARAWFCRPMFEEAGPSQTLPSPYSPGVANTQLASATSALTTSVDSVSGRLSAKQTVALDVNGNVSGTVSENDGVRSSFSVLADVFRVISSGLTGFEIQGGYQRNYSSGAQLVMGHNFGSGDLIFWYGPNIGAANCTKANATIWFDKSGNAYFGGSLSAGVLKNSAQTTVLTANPTITVGPFGTNGKTKVVTVGYSATSPTYTQYYPGRPESAGPPPPPETSQGPKTVTLYRSYAGGASTQVASVPVSHGASVTRESYVLPDAFDPNLPGGGWVQDFNLVSGASLTYSDTLVGTGNFTYTAAAGSPTYTMQKQSLSVTSVEQP